MNRLRIFGALLLALLLPLAAVGPVHAAAKHVKHTSGTVYACLYQGTKGVDETLSGVGVRKSAGLIRHGWSGKTGRWLPGSTNRVYVVGRTKPTAESCPQPSGAQPAGTSDFSPSCTMLFVDYPIAQAPAEASFEYFVDGVSLGENFVGYAYPGQGLHVLTLEVAGQTVDSDQFRILSCQDAFKGQSDFSTSSTMLFVDYPIAQAPAEASFEYFVDGVSLGENFVGYAYPGQGSHVLTLKVGPEVVDVDSFVIG